LACLGICAGAGTIGIAPIVVALKLSLPALQRGGLARKMAHLPHCGRLPPCPQSHRTGSVDVWRWMAVTILARCPEWQRSFLPLGRLHDPPLRPSDQRVMLHGADSRGMLMGGEIGHRPTDFGPISGVGGAGANNSACVFAPPFIRKVGTMGWMPLSSLPERREDPSPSLC
jgi:hypothetical protein